MSKGKLYFFYSTMNAGKSASLILKEFQFRQSGSVTFVLKPSADTRSQDTINSRAIKNELPAYTFDNNTNLHRFIFSLMGQHLAEHGNLQDVCVFVDEINFATEEQIQQLWELTRSRYGVKVFCYGLKTNYYNELFTPVKRLMVLADSVEELKSKCSTDGCDNKAMTHIRFVDGKPILEGEEVVVGDVNVQDNYYRSVCQDCYHKLTNTYKYSK